MLLCEIHLPDTFYRLSAQFELLVSIVCLAQLAFVYKHCRGQIKVTYTYFLILSHFYYLMLLQCMWSIPVSGMHLYRMLTRQNCEINTMASVCYMVPEWTTEFKNSRF